jgi:hypothetical protein
MKLYENMQNETFYVLRIHGICDVSTAHLVQWIYVSTDTMRNEAIHILRTLGIFLTYRIIKNS